MARETRSRSSSERRKDERHDVHLRGRMRLGEKFVPLEVGDLSRTGALILMKGAPERGAAAELWIEDYGPVAIEVMHSGAYFCGVSFREPTAHRLKLQYWLGEESGPQQTSHAECESDAAPLAADAAG
jgi:hypothetical protein